VSHEEEQQVRISQMSVSKRALLAHWLHGEHRPLANVDEVITRRATFSPVALSFAQQRLWFLSQLEPESVIYNIPNAIRLQAFIDVPILERAVNEVIQRHEILRTSIANHGGVACQVIAEQLCLPLTVIDLQDRAETEREGEAQRLVYLEARRPFDLSQAPLLRTTLLRLSPRQHILLLTLHHIVADGWSMGILYQELTTLYQAFSSGQNSPLAELPSQYADYAIWQWQWLQSEAYQSQLHYWQQQLQGAPGQIELPVDYARPAVQSHQGASQYRLLTEQCSTDLKTFSQQQGVTLFMTLLAAFKVLLYKLSAQPDIIVGIPIAGRNHQCTEGLIGFFLNTLALRSHLSEQLTFTEFLQDIRDTALQGYANQDIPFEKLLEELQPERNLSRTPLFQVFFNMLNYAEAPLGLPGARQESHSNAEEADPQSALSKFDLTLYIEEIEDCLQLRAVYATHLFGHERMAEMLRQLECLLYQVIDKPDQKIADLSLLTPCARSALPDPLTTLETKPGQPVHVMFANIAECYPASLAVKDPHESWTYEELHKRSNQLAHVLRSKGIQRQHVVAVYAHRSASLVWALLAILKAGAAFVLLDPAFPARRLVDCLRLAQPQAWIQWAATPAAELVDFLDEHSWCCRLVLPPKKALDQDALLRDVTTEMPDIVSESQDLAYIAFTSGSTGQPKGILGTHGPLAHFIQLHRQVWELNASDRFSMISGLSHDPLLRDIFTPLCLGGTLCIPEPAALMEPDRLVDWIHQEQISIMHLSPAMGKLLAARFHIHDDLINDSNPLTSLRYLFFAGDVLTRQDVTTLYQMAPQVAIVNSYGATETPQAMSYFQVPKTSALDDQMIPGKESIIPIGRGIEGVQLLIQSASGKLTGIGELGEICVRTPYLARGYLADQALTEQRFCVNPFAIAEAHDRWFRTGDLGRYLPDGNVMFVGREDDQLKVRGFRIEACDIEVTLQQQPAVRQAVVIADDDPSGEKRLVAYVELDEQSSPTVSELRHFLQTRLPEFMIPAVFVPLNHLPLTPNGKVDRQALPVPEANNWIMQGNYMAPGSHVEKILTDIWIDLLGLGQVGIQDNFFELGGHSLLAIQLMFRVFDTFQVEVPLRMFFEMPTIASLAKVVLEQQQCGKPHTPAIEKLAREPYRVKLPTP